MRGFGVFLGKELTETVRTWRLYVIPGILLAIGLMSPILAEVTPSLVGSMLDSADSGIVIEIPPATTVDAYLQFSKNAMQIALIAVIIATAGAVAGERRSGTAQLVLAKPLSRTAMIVAKAVSNWLLLLASVAVAAAVCVGVTLIIFDDAHLVRFVAWAALWWVLAAFFVAVVVCFSILVRSQAGAAGLGIGVYFAMSVGSLWEWARDHTPIGLFSAGDRILTGAADVSWAWPVVSAVLGAAALVAIGAAVFSRQEV